MTNAELILEAKKARERVAVDQQPGTDQNHQHQGQQPGHLKNDQRHSADAGHRSFQHYPHDTVDEILHLGHIVGDPGDDGSGLQPVNIFIGQSLHFFIDGQSNLLADELGSPAGVDIAHHGAHGARGGVQS